VGEAVVDVARVAPGVHWHALEDDVVVGRGHALHRPDGRVFVSVDTWRDDVFEVLAEAMVRDLPPPVYTVVDEDDREVLARWSSRRFVDHRYEADYVVPTDADPPPPPGAVVLAASEVGERRLRELDRRLRAEIERTVGWSGLPAQLLPPPGAGGPFDASQYLVVVHDGEDAGLLRLAPLPRRPRLGLVAVRAAHRRRGLARALLGESFRGLRARGVGTVQAEVDEANEPAKRLLVALGATRAGGAVELVRGR